MLKVNPNWRKTVKARSGVAIMAEHYVWWNGGKPLPSQYHFMNEAFEETRYGKWKWHRVAINAPRQNGKTKLLTGLILYCLFVKGSHILVTAHEMNAVHKIYDDLNDCIQRNQELKDDIDHNSGGPGKEVIDLKSNGASIYFRSRKNAAAGMGGTYDVVIFDEAQELKATYEAMITKTLKTVANPLTVYSGTPFLTDSVGDTFDTLLEHAETTPDLYAVRYGIDDENADITDRKLWKLTNPLYPQIISDDSFKRDISLANNVGSEGIRDFRIQNLGLWWKDKVPPAISHDLWDSTTLAMPNDPDTNVIALTNDPVNGVIAMSIASMNDECDIDGQHYDKWSHITGEILEEHSGNESWAWVGERAGTMPRNTVFILDVGALDKPMTEQLPMTANIVRLNGKEFLASQKGFIDALESGRYRHTDSSTLLGEVRNAQKRDSGDLWKFEPIRAAYDDGTPATIAGLKGVAEAVWWRNVNQPEQHHEKVLYV